MTNILAGLALILYFAFQVVAPLLKLPPDVTAAKTLAFSLLCLVQVVRALIYHLNVKGFPDWFLLKKWDKRLAADSVVVYLVLLIFCWFFVHQCGAFYLPRAQQITVLLFILQCVLGLLLFVLTLQRSKINAPIFFVVLTILLLPCAAIALVCYGTYTLLHVEGEYQLEMLVASCFVPILCAIGLLACKDSRDRIKNTKKLIVYELTALPAIPLCYMLMRAFWPPAWNPIFFAFPFLILVFIPILYTKTLMRPWRTKESAATLMISAPGRDLREVQSEISDIVKQLSSPKMVLKDARDHVDKADAYRFIGDLQVKLANFIEAEKCYRSAVDSYNDALTLDNNDRTAIASKFRTVELLDEVQRSRY